MANIFLTPVGNLSLKGSFQRTVLDGVNYQGKIQKLWGVLCSDTTWNKLNIGDTLLIYNQGEIVYSASIKAYFIDIILSEKLWGHKKKFNNSIYYWDKIMVLNKLKRTQLSYDLLKEFAGYKPKASVRYFFKYSTEGQEKLIKKFSSLENFKIEITVTNRRRLTGL